MDVSNSEGCLTMGACFLNAPIYNSLASAIKVYNKNQLRATLYASALPLGVGHKFFDVLSLPLF